MSPAMTQSSLSLLNNASDGSDGETEDKPEPALTPTLLTPTPCPTPSPTPTPSPAAPNITSFAPSSPVYDTEGETRTFNITTDHVVNVSWLINGTEVQTTESVAEASYTNISAAVGTWNVSAVVTNENGTVSRTWIWNVAQQATPATTPGPTPSPSPITSPSATPTPISLQSLASNITPLTPFYIYGYVAHENGTQCYAPFVVVTILNTSSNTSEEFIAENHTKSHFYQVITSSAHVKAGDVLQIEVSKKGAPVGNATYSVTHEDIHRGVTEVNINGGSPDLTDLEVTDIDIPCILNPCFEGRGVHINVTITNIGAINATDFTVYLKEGIGEENTSGSIFFNKTVPGLNSGENVSIPVNWTPKKFAWYTITASINNTDDNNKANNEMYKEVPVYAKYEFTVENVSVYPNGVREGENVAITATIRNLGIENGSVDVSFYVNSTDFAGSSDDRFIEIERAEKTVYVEVGKTNSTSIPWRVDVTGGDHLIYAVVNPDNNLTEWPQLTHRLGKSIILKNQTLAGNNVKNCTLHVIKPDLNITKLTLDPPKPVEGDLVNVTADIRNEGIEKANSTVWFYMEEEGKGKVPSTSGVTWSPYVVSSLSRPENMTIRVHFDYITISNGWTSEGGFGYWGYDDVFCADMDGQPMDFYVRSDDVVDGQPIKVAEIDFNTSCGKCTEYNMHEGELFCTYKRWENVWTEWSNGKNLELKVSPQNKYTMGIFIDKYQVRLGNRTITLNAGECMPYKVTWNTSSQKTGENYTLVANVEDKVERNETFLRTTDLAVTNLSVEKEVLDGNQSWINATVKNVDRKNATAFLINFTEIYVPTGGPPVYGVTVSKRYNDSTLLNSINIITNLEGGTAKNISVPWNASIRNILCEGECQKGGVPYSPCKWNETAENYTIKVEINPLDNIEVEENNDKEEKVHVKRSRDFSVTNLSFTVDNETRVPDSYGKVNFELGENVTLKATFNITNLANRGDTVNVGFYIDEIDTEHEIGNLSINFSVNETKSVKLENWIVWNFSEVNIAGDHNMTVVVDPENKIIEFNDSNNGFTGGIHVKAPEFTVTNISFNPELPEPGDNVTINVTIANYGDKNATNVAMAIYDWANRHIDNVAGLEEYSGFPSIEVKRENATAMRLYLDLDIEGGEVCIQNSRDEQIKCYNDVFHGWTSWFLDNNITVVTNGDAYAKVSKVYYLESSKQIFPLTNTTTTYNLTSNESSNIPVNWTASPVGERLIAAIINPGINIPEYNELNNTLTSYVSVQTADLIVSNLALQFNDTKIKHGDVVTITANVTNAGVDNAPDFDVRFFVDDILIENKQISNLTNGSTELVSADWTAKVGKQVIKVEADYDNEIVETNETNNIEAQEIPVCGAEVSGNESWESLGLHGEILFDNKTQLYDEDAVNITVNITNFGCLNANDFNVLLFYNHTPEYFDKYVGWNTAGEKWKNESYPDAKWVYLRIIDRARKEEMVKWNPMDAGDVYVYDAWSKAALNETNFNSTCNWTQVTEGKSCWIPVPGNTTNVSVNGEQYETFIIYFYPVYQNERSKLFEEINVPVNSSQNVSMHRTVSVGNFTITAIIDPENKVPEDNKTDNIMSRKMEVLPAKDFAVMNISPETRANLSDDYMIDITANVSNLGYRNGTTKVRFVDYESETRIHRYYFNKSFNLSEYNLPYLPISPNETILQPYRDLVIIHRPGVDAIHLNYSWELYKGFTESSQWIPHGEIWICNETGEIWRASYGDETKPEPIDWVQGDTAYIHTINAKFNLSGYTTKKEFHEEENVRLNASVTWNNTTKNITAMWSEAKNITRRWTASPGDHNITVIIDPDDEISEMNETNNTYVPVQLSVNATKDPEIMDLNTSPRNPRNGDDVIITAVAHNNGTANANFTVDLWMDTLKDSSAAPVPHNWNVTVGGKTRYITLLNHTELSLAPGEEANVTATWKSISVYGNPTYIVRAVVAPLVKIDEINESNNELNAEIIMNYPDLTVAGFNAPTNKTKNASVTIKNVGGDDASNVTVMLELIRHKLVGYTGITDMNETRLDITEKGASRIRVHFDKLDVTTDENAFLVIKDKDGEKVKYYGGGAFEPFWSPWVKGDTILIYYCGADFCIDECEWGDVYTTLRDFNASESVDVWPPKNGTYKSWNRYDGLAFLNATVDPYDEVIEQREDNNNKNATIYVDLVLKEIKIEGNKLKPVIRSDDTVEYGMTFNTSRNFTISLETEYNSSYETILTKPFEETIYGGEERDDVWFDIYECLDKFHFEANNKSKIRVKVDSEDDIEELNEGNNEKEMEIGPDIEIAGIEVWPGYPVVGRHTCRINVILRNKGCLPAEDFDVNCTLNITYLNAGIESEEVPLTQKEFSLDLNGTVNGTRILTFEWDPPSHYAAPLPYYDVSQIRVEADPEPSGVDELDETNNEEIRSETWRIYTETGYGANHPLETKYHDEMVNCNVSYYKTGDNFYLDSYKLRKDDSEALFEFNSTHSHYGPIDFNNVIPEGATGKVKHARLYLYWTWGYVEVDDPLCPGETKPSPAPLNVGVTFNDRTFNEPDPDGNHVDLPTATGWDVAWGTYAYDVTSIIEKDNTVSATRKLPENIENVTGFICVPTVAGMVLLVIYERDDLPLTTYWINEGADVLYMLGPTTGLTPDDCTTNAPFNGKADLDRVNATLWTIVPCGDTVNNRLFFNSGQWDGIWQHGTITWPPGMDNRYVTDYLISQDNEARLQDRGDGGGMMPSNAFLILSYPPDLEPFLNRDTAVMGGKYPVIIRNNGRSRSSGFDVNVNFSRGGLSSEYSEHINSLDANGAEETLEVPLPKWAFVGQTITITAEVNYTKSELTKENNIKTRDVTIVEGPIIPPKRPGGGGGGTGEGWGTGTGAGEGGAGDEGAEAMAGGREGAVGESRGKEITGYLMKGSVATSEEEGGGKGEFSMLALLMRLMMLAAAVVLVCAGYLMERRRQKHKLSLKKKV